MNAVTIAEVAIGYCLGSFIVGFAKGLRSASKEHPPHPPHRVPGAPPNPGRVSRY